MYNIWPAFEMSQSKTIGQHLESTFCFLGLGVPSHLDSTGRITKNTPVATSSLGRFDNYFPKHCLSELIVQESTIVPDTQLRAVIFVKSSQSLHRKVAYTNDHLSNHFKKKCNWLIK